MAERLGARKGRPAALKLLVSEKTLNPSEGVSGVEKAGVGKAGVEKFCNVLK